MAKRTHRNPDHIQRHNRPSPDNEEIANQLEALLTPAIFAQQAYYRELGLRDRKLESAVNGSSSVDIVVETSSRCTRIKPSVSTRSTLR